MDLLILLPPPPVSGLWCVQPCLVLWDAGDQTQGHEFIQTTETEPQAPGCAYVSERDCSQRQGSGIRAVCLLADSFQVPWAPPWASCFMLSKLLPFLPLLFGKSGESLVNEAVDTQQDVRVDRTNLGVTEPKAGQLLVILNGLFKGSGVGCPDGLEVAGGSLSAA